MARRSLHPLVSALLLLRVMAKPVWADARSAALRSVRTYARFGRLSNQQQVTALQVAGEHIGSTRGSAQTNRPVPVTELAAAKEGGGAYKVHVKVYLESKCPACRF